MFSAYWSLLLFSRLGILGSRVLIINALCYNVCVPVTRVILMGLVMLECLVFGSHQGAPLMVRLL